MYKHLNITYFLLISLFFSCISGSLSAQKKWEKHFLKNDRHYEKGSYKKARKSNRKLMRKSEKKLGPENSILARAYFKEAKYYAGAGYMNQYRKSMEAGLDIAATVYDESQTAYALALFEPVEIYTRYGDFLEAEVLLARCNGLLTSADSLSPSLEKKIKLSMAGIHAGQGFYVKALDALEEMHPFMLNKIQPKTTRYTDKKTNETKTRKLSSAEQKKLYEQYGRYLNLKAETYKRWGNLEKADSILSFAKSWIGKNLSKSHASYSKNLLLKGSIHKELGNYKECIRQYEKAYALITRKYRKSHQQVIATQEQLLRIYLEQGKKNKYQTVVSELKKNVNRYYNRKSVHHSVDELAKLSTPLDKGNIEFLTKRAHKLTGHKSSIPEQSEKRVAVLNFLYLTSLINHQYQQGQQYLTEILTIKKALFGQHSPVYHLAKLKLANHFIDHTNQLSEAHAIYRESFTEVVEKEITPGHTDYVEIINHQAELYELADSYQESSRALEMALQATREKFKEDDIRQGIALDRFSNLQLKIGHYQAAAYNINLAIDILKRNKSENQVIHYAKALETRAKLLAAQGYYDEARSDINKSEKLQGKSDLASSIYTVNTIDELAQLYMEMGKYAKTEKLLKKSLNKKIKRYGKESRKLIRPLTELGRLQYIRGEFTEAEKTVRRALQLAGTSYTESSTKTTPARILLSSIYTEMGDLDKAKEQSLKSLAIRQEHFGESHIHVARAYTQLAGIRLRLKENADEIESMLKTAQQIAAEKLGIDNPLYAEVIQQLAALYMRQNQFPKALDLLNEANRIWADKIGKRNNLNAAIISSLLGDIYYKQQSYSQAGEHYHHARKRYEKIFNKKHPSYVKLLSKSSKVHYMNGNYRQAKNLMEEALLNYADYIKNYFPALSENQKHKYWHTIKDDFEYFNTLALKYPDLIGKMYNNALITKALLLNSSMKMRQRILNSDDETLKMKYAEWIDLKELQASILSMSAEEIESNDIDPVQLDQEIELLEKFLSEKSTLFASKIENANVDWKDIRSSLQNDELALEMVRFRYFDHALTDSVIYALLFVQKEMKGAPEVVFLNNGKTLETKYFNFYRNALRFRLEDTYSYANFWEPIKSRLEKYSTVYLSPDGVYNQINLETIPTPAKHYVIDEANIVVLRNTKELYFRKNQKTETLPLDNTAFILGNPEFYTAGDAGNRFISPLPASEKEVMNLSEMLRSKGYTFDYYLHRDATERAVKSTQSPKIFHVATHGFFEAPEQIQGEDLGLDVSWRQASQNPLLRSGILLANSGDILKQATFQYNKKDGILTAFEAMNLNLDQTELVVLSACETGLGQIEIGEGVYGLQRAFLQAGAKSLVMSLFKVSDEATQKLMSNFYQKWLESGDKRASFVAAKKEIKSQYPNPLDWGAFVMVGLGM